MYLILHKAEGGALASAGRAKEQDIGTTDLVWRKRRVAANSVEELVALAKSRPGKLQYASAGIGSVTHLAGELFKYTAKVDMLHVPFRGEGPPPST